MSQANTDFVQKHFPTLEDIEVAEIVATQATERDLLEARAWLDGDDDVTRPLGEPSNERVEKVIAIAEEAEDEDTEEDEPTDA